MPVENFFTEVITLTKRSPSASPPLPLQLVIVSDVRILVLAAELAAVLPVPGIASPALRPPLRLVQPPPIPLRIRTSCVIDLCC